MIFAGTSQLACQILISLISNSEKPIAILTLPDRRFGRKKILQPLPVKRFAERNDLRVFSPENLQDQEFLDQIGQLNLDLLLVVDYGKMIPESLIKLFHFRGINIHMSLLPRWRGATPIESALLAGDKETGISLIEISKNLDAGRILDQFPISIQKDSTSGSLRRLLTEKSCEILPKFLRTFRKDHFKGAKEQSEEGICYCQKLTKESARIDWMKENSQIERMIRAYNPKPGAFTGYQQNKITITTAKVADQENQSFQQPGTISKIKGNTITVTCGYGDLEIQELQMAGKKSMTIREIQNGYRNFFQIGKLFK